MDWKCYRGYTYTWWKTLATSQLPSVTKPNSRVWKLATATLMRAILSECAPHQSRKAAECVRRLHISIKVSSSLTTACDMTVDSGRLRLKERPVRTRSGAGPGGCADVGRRAAPATATTTSSRTTPPGRSDTVCRRAAPATATAPAPPASGPAATGAATADHDRRDAPATTPATRECAHVGDRTHFIRCLASEAGDACAVDRPRGVFVAVTLAIYRLAALCFVCQFAIALYLNVLLYRLRDIGWWLG